MFLNLIVMYFEGISEGGWYMTEICPMGLDVCECDKLASESSEL